MGRTLRLCSYYLVAARRLLRGMGLVRRNVMGCGDYRAEGISQGEHVVGRRNCSQITRVDHKIIALLWVVLSRNEASCHSLHTI
jgi:hypothetical protein